MQGKGGGNVNHDRRIQGGWRKPPGGTGQPESANPPSTLLLVFQKLDSLSAARLCASTNRSRFSTGASRG
jgi:hypothetical protein